MHTQVFRLWRKSHSLLDDPRTEIRNSQQITLQWFCITESPNILCAKISFGTFRVSIDAFLWETLVWDTAQLMQFWNRASWETVMWSYMKVDQWFRRRCLFRFFLIWSPGGPFVQRSRTICAFLVEGVYRNKSVKLFWTSDSRGDAF